jgi:uncharacterized membrane protein YuzA (DUF378 family)
MFGLCKLDLIAGRLGGKHAPLARGIVIGIGISCALAVVALGAGRVTATLPRWTSERRDG